MESYTKNVLLKKLSVGQLVENEFVEFKEKWQQESGKYLSAIGNRDIGGWLIIGVDDKGNLINRDLDQIKKQKNLVENHVTQYLFPSSAVQFISIESINEKYCIFVEVRNPNSIVSWNEKFYKRVGSRTEKMSEGEKKDLELKLPGFDFSDLKYKGEIDSALVMDYANFLTKDNGGWIKSSPEEILSKLNIKGKNVSGILFGDFSFRLVHYDKESEILDQKEEKGLYKLLKKDFISNICVDFMILLVLIVIHL